MVITILSMGAGINSVACLIRYAHLYKYVIFADTGEEKPATYEYIERFLKPFCKARGITWITVKSSYGMPLTEYFTKHKLMPNQNMRACTKDFKIRPIMRAVKKLGATNETPFYEHIGIARDEAWRKKMSKHDKPYLIKQWPLIDDKLTRDDCCRIIRDHGWPLPVKSGCTGCFYAKRAQFVQLYREQPEIFMRWLKMEESARNFPKYKWHISGKPLRPLMHVGSLDGFIDDSDQVCDEGYCMESGAEDVEAPA